MPHQNMAELSSWWAKASVSVGGGPHGGGGNQIFLFLDLSFFVFNLLLHNLWDMKRSFTF